MGFFIRKHFATYLVAVFMAPFGFTRNPKANQRFPQLIISPFVESSLVQARDSIRCICSFFFVAATQSSLICICCAVVLACAYAWHSEI